MTKSTPRASSGSNSSVPNTGMPMGQIPWPQPAYIPGYAPPQNYPYGMPLNGTHGAAPQYAPVAPTAAAPPPQYPPAPPPYYQPFPSNSLPGAANPYVPPMLPQGYLQQQNGAGLATGSAQVPIFSVAKKRVAEDLGARDAKRTKVASCSMKNDPLFKPVLDQHGQPDGTFFCSRDGMVLNPESYLKHIKTKKHLGFKLEKYKCPSPACRKTYTRRDACKRHWDDGCAKLAPEGARLSYADAHQLFMGSAPVAPMAAPTAAFTYHYPYPMPVASMSQNMQVAPPAASVDAQAHGTPSFLDPALCLSQPQENDTVTEPVEDEDEDDDAEFWEANEIRDIQEM
ncbi:hypothetical protein EV702DRAFT_75310 [Suillus placidus]|uniref:Uncharacterized protein n=1 Tax=Suillus placidus TaxID=48579 RepID=A0A9P7A0L1_9AGAM|nr:hypothetical protein EV702DRAFT_75310 [Suillus placidus]